MRSIGSGIAAWSRRHPVAWRAAFACVALALFAVALVSFGFGGCHDSGGFCASEFGSVHIEAYASSAALAALGTLVAACCFTRRIVVLASTAVAAAALVGLAAIGAESLL